MSTLAVTTRSHLRGVRFFFPMYRASRRIKKQLARTPGCIRFATIVMGPREFWTLTVWRSRGEMLDFMRSGEHEDIMWVFARWLDSFWLMRWRPTTSETGSWDGTLAAAPELPATAPERTPEQAEALQAALDAIPRLRAAAGPDGAAVARNAPSDRRARTQVAGGVGTTLRLEMPAWRTPSAWLKVRRLHGRIVRQGLAERSAFGLARRGEIYLLAIFKDRVAWERALASDEMAALRTRWPAGLWTMRWEADNEFGHWDGLRMRKLRLGSVVPIPRDVAGAVTAPGEDGFQGETRAHRPD